MVKIVTNFENGVQIEEAPNSLRTIKDTSKTKAHIAWSGK